MQEIQDNTLRRLAYLQAMGVPGFVSRRQAPGAAPSRRLAVVHPHASAAPKRGGAAASATESSGIDPVPVADPPRRAPARRRPMLDVPDWDADKRRPHPDTVSGMSATRVAGPDSQCKFSLVAMFAGRWLWLENMDEMPLASDQLALVQGMAYALGFPGSGDASPVPQVESFDWPMHSNRQLDSGRDAARASLSAFLLRRIQQQACAGVVLLGDDCEHWVDAAQLPVPVVTVASSAQMLARPALKPRAWRSLQVLRVASIASER